ncbi:MAG: hypothetical protein FWG68_06460 [Defluviitaleaceae bacterium]|nr:hypothetical protein [Defluviitaleaceae bacterium]
MATVKVPEKSGKPEKPKKAIKPESQTSQEYGEILAQKLKALTLIFDATKRANFTTEGDKEHTLQEIERFASLYEQRADIIAKIQQMDEQLAKNDKKMSETKENLATIAKIKETAKAIAEMDKINNKTAEEFRVFVKKGLKNIRDGRDVSTAYNDIETRGDTSGYFFDKAN